MGDSEEYLNLAIKSLESHPNIADLKISKYYSSKPHGPQNQPDYLNTVIVLNTDLEPEPLLDLLQQIENDNDRVREGVERWGARTLDLDLLFYGKTVINTERLIVPHPRICERAFVLLPLRDLIGDENLIDFKIHNTSILECINALSKEELHNIEELENGQTSNG